MATQKKYIVKQLGTLDETTRVLKFAFKLPSYCKALGGVLLFSPVLITSPAEDLNAELSMWINNQRSAVGNYLFTLGYAELDEQHERMIDVNQQLIPGTEISGYVKYLTAPQAFDIHLILECKL